MVRVLVSNVLFAVTYAEEFAGPVPGGDAQEFDGDAGKRPAIAAAGFCPQARPGPMITWLMTTYWA
ncbi:hypothetical protein [Streptomyces sp. NPDC056949]|uniref:hypothetical protein n=1 Tax=Streptomyces sp. NPDC056949 TaxID=3345976 RepID=UPI0036385826